MRQGLSIKKNFSNYWPIWIRIADNKISSCETVRAAEQQRDVIPCCKPRFIYILLLYYNFYKLSQRALFHLKVPILFPKHSVNIYMIHSRLVFITISSYYKHWPVQVPVNNHHHYLTKVVCCDHVFREWYPLARPKIIRFRAM